MTLRAEGTIASLTIRQLISGRSGLVVIFFALVPSIVAALLHLRESADPVPFVLSLYTQLVITVMLPIVALVFGVGAFGGEIDDGTIAYVLTKPVPRWRIAIAKLVSATLLTALVVVGSAVLAGFIAFGGMGSNNVIAGFAAALAFGSVLYCAVFVALGLVIRRAIIVGLAYVVVWEGVAASTFAGTRTFSISEYIRTIADWLVTVDAGTFSAQLPLSTAIPMAAAVLAFAALLTIHRLRSFQLAQEA